jgi:predicted MFS family arabinose efflux permease
MGQPWAWIVGMPLLGFAGEASWRYAWLAFPLAAALLAAAAVASRRGAPAVQAPPAHLREALAAPQVGRWLTAEVLANTAWAGTLVYAGALLVDSYRTSAAATGVLLAIGAGASVLGNVALRRLSGEPRRWLVGLAFALAVVTTTFDAFRPSLVVSTVLFAIAGFAAGGRTLLSGAFGLSLSPAFRPAAMSMRAASLQFGYFTGSLSAGTAFALGGDVACGATAGALFAASAFVLMRQRPAGENVGREPASYPGRALENAA